MATEKRLIDAAVFAEHLERMTRTAYPNLFPGLLEAADYAKDFPTVDAVEVVHSEWETELDELGWLKHTCPICGYVKRTDIHVRLGWNYCPNCGAKMDGAQE